MTTRSLIATAAAALVAGTLLSAGAFAAAPAAPTSHITKVSSVKASKHMDQLAQAKKKKSKSKKKSKGKKKKKM